MSTLVMVIGTLLLVALGAGLLYRLLRRDAMTDVPQAAGTRVTLGLGAAALAVLGLLTLWIFPAVTLPQPRVYRVLIAPFTVNGAVDETGRRAAEQLAGVINAAEGTAVRADLADTAPADPTAAQRQLAGARADALLWGEIAPGGVIDSPTLLPQLVLAPRQSDLPDSWDGYTGRFATPTVFQLASAPINPRVTLPPLLLALAAYANGEVDTATTTLDRLAQDTPDLAPTLPRMLRGNLHWASGDFRAAADEYRRIPAVVGRGGTAADAALANNLGAILQDAGDPEARAAFNRAIALLNGADLGELRYNLAIEDLRAGRGPAAVAGLEQARNLLPATSGIYFALAEAARLSGPDQFDRAASELNQGLSEATAASGALGGELEPLLLLRGQTTALEQRGLLALARLLQAHGPLLWELWRVRDVPADQLSAIQRDMALAAADSARLAQQWRERGARDTAASLPAAALVADEQARRATQSQQDRQLWADAIEVQLALRQTAPTSSVWGLFSSPPASQARERLEARAKQDSNDITALVLAAQANQVARRGAEAERLINLAIANAPGRPEPYYIRALMLQETDPAQAETLLLRSLDADPGFFPAGEALADLAEQRGDYTTAIARLRAVVAVRPGAAEQLALGRALRLGGSFKEAESLLLPAANANDIGALRELGALYADYGDLDAAQAALLRAQQLTPENVAVTVALADVLRRAEKPAEAEAQYRRALTFQPSDATIHLKLANLYAEQSNPRAAAEYEAALNIQNPSPRTLREIGDALLQRDEPLAAVKAYERAVAMSDADPELRHQLATAYLRTGQLDQARAAEQKALDLKGGAYPEALVGLGGIALQSEKPDEAFQLFNRALELQPRMTNAQIGLGQVAIAQNSWNVALTRFRSAVQDDPTSAEAQLWLGEGLIRHGEPKTALDAYDKALTLRPRYAEAHFGKGQALLVLERADEALTELDTAIRLRPRYAEALLLRGRLYEGRGDLPEALRNYNNAIAANPQLAEPYFQRGLALVRQERFDAARADFTAAVTAQHTYPEAHYWLGRVLLAQGNPQQALDSLKTAVAQRAGYVEARYYQGVAEEQSGKLPEAADSYRAVQQADSSGVWSREARSALQRLGVQQ